MRKLTGFIVIALFCSCSINNINEDKSLSQYFNHNQLDGTFGLFDNISGEFTIYNVSRYRDSAYLPASTFDIVNTLIGIEIGRVRDSAQAIPSFGELAQRIGKDTLQRWLDTLGYGRRYNKPVIQDNLDTFWLDNSLKVTADEQLGLVKKLYFGQLPFQARSQRMVKNMMLQEDNANYKLSYKIGEGYTDKGYKLGWIVGWIEENRHPYFFVFQLQSRVRNSWEVDLGRVDLLKEILRKYGFMEGKR
ncbi:MAG: class D beta-lactamase [Chitinophagaceae bacterium]|nr:class D beta-lactamase [Chitinophagaceae bacterium]